MCSKRFLHLTTLFTIGLLSFDHLVNSPIPMSEDEKLRPGNVEDKVKTITCNEGKQSEGISTSA